MVSPRATPPVVRLVEWSKVLFELQKRDKAAGKAKAAQARAAEAKEVCVCVLVGGGGARGVCWGGGGAAGRNHGA